MHAHILDTAEKALNFMLAGHAKVTFVSKKTGTRYTYKLSQSDDGQVIFVALLRGPDNESDFSYFGFIRDYTYRFGGTKARIARDAPSAKAFEWAWNALAGGRIPEQLEIWHEGACGRCGRPLTVPESIERGIGPDCWEMMGGM